MHAAGSSSAQADRRGLMDPIQRSRNENVGNIYDNRSSAQIDKQRDALQFISLENTLSRFNMVSCTNNSIPLELFNKGLFFEYRFNQFHNFLQHSLPLIVNKSCLQVTQAHFHRKIIQKCHYKLAM